MSLLHMRLTKESGSLQNIFITIAIGLSVVSQCFLETSSIRLAMYATWLIAFLFLLLQFKFKFEVGRYFVEFAILAFFELIYILVAGFFSNGAHWDSPIIRGIFLVFFIYWVGTLLGNRGNGTALFSPYIVYIATVLFFCFYLFVTYVGSLQSFFSVLEYQIRQKNSAGQIIGIAILMLFSLKQLKRKTWVQYILIVTFCFFLLITRCRSSLVGLTVAGLYFVKDLKLRNKFLVVFLGVALILFIFGDFLIDFVSSSLRLESYENADLDTISSGRISLLREGWAHILESPWMGSGYFGFDAFYISVFSRYGLLGAPLILLIYGLRVFRNFNTKRTCMYIGCGVYFDSGLFLRMASLFYLCISCFEGIPPFGPGVACCMFWLISGFIDTYETGHKNLLNTMN